MRSLKFLMILISILTAMSCAMYYQSHPIIGVVEPNSDAKNEVIMTDYLKRLLIANPKPKLVIRVPNPPSNVTAAEQFNYFVNIIEKVFIENGYIVRDRALLENILRSGSSDYKTIGVKTDTDIIIDILSLQFDIPNKIYRFFNKTTYQQDQFATEDNYIDCPLAKLECRVTLVERGQLGGAFTFYTSRCDLERLEFYVSASKYYMIWANKGTSPIHLSLAAPIENEETKEFIIRNFAYTLINHLSAVQREQL